MYVVKVFCSWCVIWILVLCMGKKLCRIPGINFFVLYPFATSDGFNLSSHKPTWSMRYKWGTQFLIIYTFHNQRCCLHFLYAPTLVFVCYKTAIQPHKTLVSPKPFYEHRGLSSIIQVTIALLHLGFGLYFSLTLFLGLLSLNFKCKFSAKKILFGQMHFIVFLITSCIWKDISTNIE